MREEYIKNITKRLSISRKQKREIIRDINEAFDSAKEHGESEEQVIERLGTPSELAESMEETVGLSRVQYKKTRRRLLAIYCSSAIAVFCLVSGFIVKCSELPDNTIGQSDSMTQIAVNDFWSFDIWIILLIIGIVFAIGAVALIAGLVRKNKF